MNLLNTNGYVEISALCRMFNVTEMTIRRDLDQLAQYNDIERTRAEQSDRKPPFMKKQDLNTGSTFIQKKSFKSHPKL
ncbi:DeoR family transcriptional regulator [[Clostridium] hylemonae]|uniref:DeoR family transcriptional regulator n=1 Tax=[Clostridium] hylemonae TaxID=89153 RepID=UPI00147940E8|nr:DeoR family transcriptional regulator [[Clostridium] hylemonae]